MFESGQQQQQQDIEVKDLELCSRSKIVPIFEWELCFSKVLDFSKEFLQVLLDQNAVKLRSIKL